MNLDLSGDQELLRETFAGFFAKESGVDRVRGAEPLGFDEALWHELVTLGATTLAIPEAHGGGGGQTLDLALVAQEVGRRLAPVPFVETATAGNLLARAGATSLVRAVLDGALATVAVRPPVGGVCRLVPAGAVADIVIVLDGDDLIALRRHDASARPYVSSPPNFGSSPIADVRLDDPAYERTVLVSGAEASSLYGDARTEWKLFMAAALDGLRAAALDITVDYVKARHAFGVPLGWFQAIQHRLADVTVAGDGGRLLVYQAAWARDRGQPGAADLASMAFLFLTDVAFKTCAEGVQLHGGYGYTLEYDIQLYFRRAKAWPLALGDPRPEYQRLAERLYPIS
jgi:alkylation response protein AidB-like acyl-CoA dehydrogenase